MFRCEGYRQRLAVQHGNAPDHTTACFIDDPGGTFPYGDLRDHPGYTDASNFNKTIRRHNDFKDALESLGLVEVTKGDGPRCNAWAKLFPPIPGAYRPTAV